MSTQDFVRAARVADIDAVVGVQVAAWRTMYGPLLPEAVLTELTGAEAAAAFAEQWRAAVQDPPSSRHRLLVGTHDREVVGFVAIAPSEDPDRWPGTDGEILALHVDPDRTGQGHGSRLLNAAVDHLVDDGVRAVYVWTLEAANPLRSFLEASNWQPDGARREIDMGAIVPMVRLHAAIAP